jgi:nitronate monooxygenase
MLETERAGARALVVFLEDFPRKSSDWNTLRQVQADEAHNCALIGKLLDAAGVAHSHATGEFYDKAVALRGKRARVEFLVRGLRWAVKRFDEALPRLDAQARERFSAMRATHLRSIEACEQVAGKLPAA